MTLPFAEPLQPLDPGPRVIPEPPRRGESGGPPCLVCQQDEGIWSDEHWVLHNPAGTSLPGTVWLASRAHVDSFADLPADLAASFGDVVGRIERAVLGLGDIARVHLYRWGDGGAHFHVWFFPRPLGMLEATKFMLPLWEERLPPASAEAIAKAGEAIGASLRADQVVRSA
jgi:diadenosine tetraphosphate (Ap4A) HIT family hydrolase